MTFDDYRTGSFFDEMFDADGEPRPPARGLVQLIEAMGEGELGRRQQSAEAADDKRSAANDGHVARVDDGRKFGEGVDLRRE